VPVSVAVTGPSEAVTVMVLPFGGLAGVMVPQARGVVLGVGWAVVDVVGAVVGSVDVVAGLSAAWVRPLALPQEAVRTTTAASSANRRCFTPTPRATPA
jgi:hypothetical protein